jgi:polyisoprenoid-binding protein YceI
VIRRVFASCLTAATLILSGCFAGSDLEPSGLPPNGPAPGGAASSAGGGTERAGATDGAGAAAAVAPGSSEPKLTPVPLTDGKATLTPDNTSIGFVGTHTGAEPNPRIGGFAQFNGTAEVDRVEKTLKSATVEIKTDSLWTPIPPLTGHLKSPDFFDTGKYPTAKFVSKSVVPVPEKRGDYTMTGELTLLGKTNEVSFPVTVDVSESGLTLSGSVTLDRTSFGMDRVQDKVQKGVTVNLAIGKKTEPQTGGGPGGPGFRGGGPGKAKGKRPPAKG